MVAIKRLSGIGLDVIDASKRKATKALANRVLSPSELKKFESLASRQAAFDFLFGRWAAKEAFYKATGRSDAFTAIEIGADSEGKPVLIRPKDCSVMFSISHDKRLFAAVAVAFN